MNPVSKQYIRTLAFILSYFAIFNCHAEGAYFLNDAGGSLDAASSTSTLSATTLHILGLDSYSEALRLVPGMVITNGENVRPVVSYHGGEQEKSQRLQLMIDYFPMARSSLSEIDWGISPIDFNDVQFISVVRGGSIMPNGGSTTQGAINLLSKDALDAEGYGLGVHDGQDGKSANFSFTTMLTSDDMALVSVHANRERGYNESATSGSIDDRQRYQRAYAKLQHFTDSGFISAQAGVVNSTSSPYVSKTYFKYDRGIDWRNEYEFANLTIHNQSRYSHYGVYTTTSLFINRFDDDRVFSRYYPYGFFFPESRAYDASPTLDLTQVIAQYERTGVPYLPPAKNASDAALTNALYARFLAAGAKTFDLVPGRDNLSYQDSTAGANTNLTISDEDSGFVAESNIGIKRYETYSRTYYGGSLFDTSAFASERIKVNLSDDVALHANVSAQYRDSRNSIPLARQVALVFRPTSEYAVRVSHTITFRMPDNVEANPYWVEYVTFDPGYTDLDGNTKSQSFHTNIGKGNALDDEKTESSEISLVYRAMHESKFEVKAFHEIMTNLISTSLDYYYFDPSNSGRLENAGVELSGEKRFGMARTGVVYMYLDQQANSVWESSLYARHVGSAYTIFDITDRLKLALAHYSNSETLVGPYDRTDITLTNTFNLGNSSLEIQLLAKHYSENTLETQQRLQDPNAADLKFISPSIRYGMSAQLSW